MARSVISATWSLKPRDVGQLVDAFLLDHGEVHVGDEEFLAAVGERNEGGIDGQADPDVARDLNRVGGAGCDDLAGDALRKPVDFAMGVLVDSLDQWRDSAGSCGLAIRQRTDIGF